MNETTAYVLAYLTDEEIEECGNIDAAVCLANERDEDAAATLESDVAGLSGVSLTWMTYPLRFYLDDGWADEESPEWLES